ncbi:hypothetical protein ScPMuIL_016882 [Solemya velum]
MSSVKTDREDLTLLRVLPSTVETREVTIYLCVQFYTSLCVEEQFFLVLIPGIQHSFARHGQPGVVK